MDILKHYAVQLTKAAASEEVLNAALALGLIKLSLDAAKKVAKTKGANYDAIGNQLNYPGPDETNKCPVNDKQLSCTDDKCKGKDKKCTEVRS